MVHFPEDTKLEGGMGGQGHCHLLLLLLLLLFVQQETMTRAPPKEFTMAPYQVMLDRVDKMIGANTAVPSAA